MAYFLLILDGNIASISETIANVECAISPVLPASQVLNKDDEILVYLDEPVNKVQMQLKVAENKNAGVESVRIIKEFDTATYGLPLEELPGAVCRHIDEAKIAGETVFEISEQEFTEIVQKIFSHIEQPDLTPDIPPDDKIDDPYEGYTNESIALPYNYIFYGAPGTGKSRLCEEKRDTYFGERYERVTFYERYSYANFIGSYKPITKYDERTSSDKLEYSFVPGPFIRILLEAITHKDKNYVLIIEEINRARAASVFGDVFQLLDRDKDGMSEYPIATSEDLKRYLASKYYNNDKKLDDNQLAAFKEIRIPKNMYIWATMNSMDQGVSSLDAAFKRRWEFKYIGVKLKEGDKLITESYKSRDNKLQDLLGGKYKIPMIINNEKRYYVDWNQLREELNKLLLGKIPRIPEDKLIGPFFLSERMLSSVSPELNDKKEPEEESVIEQFLNSFESKVLMYLFDDAAKSNPAAIFSKIKTDTESLVLSDIFDAFEDKGESIFGFTNEIMHYQWDSSQNKLVEVTNS